MVGWRNEDNNLILGERFVSTIVEYGMFFLFGTVFKSQLTMCVSNHHMSWGGERVNPVSAAGVVKMSPAVGGPLVAGCAA